MRSRSRRVVIADTAAVGVRVEAKEPPSSQTSPMIPTENGKGTETVKVVPGLPSSSPSPSPFADLAFFLRRVDAAGLCTDEELEKICVITCGAKRRAVQRLLAGMHQRAMVLKDEPAARKVRTLIMLHDQDVLDQTLDAIESQQIPSSSVVTVIA